MLLIMLMWYPYMLTSSATLTRPPSMISVVVELNVCSAESMLWCQAAYLKGVKNAGAHCLEVVVCLCLNVRRKAAF